MAGASVPVISFILHQYQESFFHRREYTTADRKGVIPPILHMFGEDAAGGGEGLRRSVWLRNNRAVGQKCRYQGQLFNYPL